MRMGGSLQTESALGRGIMAGEGSLEGTGRGHSCSGVCLLGGGHCSRGGGFTPGCCSRMHVLGVTPEALQWGGHVGMSPRHPAAGHTRGGPPLGLQRAGVTHHAVLKQVLQARDRDAAIA